MNRKRRVWLSCCTIGIIAAAICFFVVVCPRKTSEDIVLDWLAELPPFVSPRAGVRPWWKPHWLHSSKKPRFNLKHWIANGKKIPRCRPILVQLLSSESPSLVQRAAFGLEYVGDASSVPPLMAVLKHGDSRARAMAASALGQIGDDRAVELLAKVAWSDLAENVAMNAVFALGEIGTPDAVQHLHRLVAERPENGAGLHAIIVLGGRGTRPEGDLPDN